MKIKYEANDGTLFNDQAECLVHDERLKQADFALDSLKNTQSYKDMLHYIEHIRDTSDDDDSSDDDLLQARVDVCLSKCLHALIRDSVIDVLHPCK